MSNIEIRLVQNQQELDDMYEQCWLVLRSPLKMLIGTEKDKHGDSAFHTGWLSVLFFRRYMHSSGQVLIFLIDVALEPGL